MELEEKTVSSELAYEGYNFQLYQDQVQLPNGKVVQRDVVRHRGAVAAVPIELDEDGWYVYLVEQYRYATGKVLLEIPAGKIEEGEIPDHTMVRELIEEVGKFPHRLILLSTPYLSPGYSSERIYIYAASDLEDRNSPNLDSEEFLNIRRIPLMEALDMIEDGQIEDGKTIIGLKLVGDVIEAVMKEKKETENADGSGI
jgi:ADP-ribose pyrophosphatase